ncbi:MAG: molybdopterin converting factor subunit 1 [Chromatiales bacterium]|nr:molybdopterin converting factor subunit 1 [Chromatiales bacterium]
MIGWCGSVRKPLIEGNSMTVKVKFFASLKEQMGCDGATVEIGEVATAADIWLQASGGKALPPNVLVAVNMEYTDQNHAVKSGDEVAFFPPVTGG